MPDPFTPEPCETYSKADCDYWASVIERVVEEAYEDPDLVNFDGAGRTVADINSHLRQYGIFGGKDLWQDFPALGQSALYCFTETHTADDIDRLTSVLEEVLS